MKQMTIDDIATALCCSNRTLYSYLGNWRFMKFIKQTNPYIYNVDLSFITTMSEFLMLRQKSNRRCNWVSTQMNNNLGNLYKLVTSCDR